MFSKIKIIFASPSNLNYFLVRPKFSAIKYKTNFRKMRVQKRLLKIKSLKRFYNYRKNFRALLLKANLTSSTKLKRFYNSNFTKFHKLSSYTLPKFFRKTLFVKNSYAYRLSMAKYLSK